MLLSATLRAHVTPSGNEIADGATIADLRAYASPPLSACAAPLESSAVPVSDPAGVPGPVPRLSRRSLLAAAVGGALLTAACTGDEGRAAPHERPESEPEVDPDIAVAAGALRQQEQMLELLRATGERHGGLAPRLEGALSAHQEHAAMLRKAVPANAASPSPTADDESTPGSSPSGTPSSTPGSASSGAGTAPVYVARRPRRALESVVQAEEELGAAMRQHAFRAESGAFARVLGSMAASSSQHAFLLRSSLTRGGGR